MSKLILADYRRYRRPILDIRKRVFTDEQQVPPALEVDELDPLSQHLLLFDNANAVATGRLTPNGQIGRIAVLKEARGRGFGRQVMLGLERLAQQQAFNEVVLGAQRPVIPFYEKLGYQAFGEFFMDAGIEHRMMRKILHS
jgi:predicted GNAT family N-acyltransferase